MSAIIDLSALELIPKILEQNEKLIQEVDLLKKELVPKLDLSKRADVKKYLNISESTLFNMTKDGRLREGYHFHRSIKNNKCIITFVSGAIVEFKRKNYEDIQ